MLSAQCALTDSTAHRECMAGELAFAWGGAMYSFEGRSTVVRSVIRRCSANTAGYGNAAAGAVPRLTQCPHSHLHS